jgi:transcriptional regulator with XRE-family HTH domain
MTVEHRDITDDDVAGAVRAELARRSRKINELPAVVGLSAPTVSSRIHGVSSFSIEELRKIADFLDMTLSDLLESALLGHRVMNPTRAYAHPTQVEVSIRPAHRDPLDRIVDVNDATS